MSFPRILAPMHTHLVNKIAFRFVGFTTVADLEHVGRRTGQIHHTPVRAYRRDGAVVIGINFGRRSDWVKNIQAAQGCRMRQGSELLELAEARLVPIKQGMKLMPPLVGLALRYVVRTHDCLLLSIVRTDPVPRLGAT